MTRVALNVPSVVVKVTGTPDSARPVTLSTLATNSTVPPRGGTKAGLARSVTLSTAAAPMVICTTLVDVVVVVPLPVPVLAVPPAAPRWRGRPQCRIRRRRGMS